MVLEHNTHVPCMPSTANYVQLIRAFALLPVLFSTIANAVHPVEIRGQDFVDTVTNSRLMIIGVDYQPGGQGAYNPSNSEDALTNADVCLRDAVLMQKLGVNTIRVYNVDPTLDHSLCASIFNAAGIYMIIDVNSPLPGESINREAPWTSYNSDYLTRVFGIVENFKGFPNTLAFFSANEVMNDLATAEFNPQYIRVSSPLCSISSFTLDIARRIDVSSALSFRVDSDIDKYNRPFNAI